MNTVTLGEIWRNRELMYFFAWRDIKVRYKQAALGAAWAVLQPLLSTIVFIIFFYRLAKIPSDGLPPLLFYYVGLMLWTYFTSVITHAGQSLTANTNLITKIYFPRVALPVSAALSGLLDIAASLPLAVVFMLYYRTYPGWPVVLLPVYLAGTVLFTIGVSLLLSAFMVRYRDVKYTLPLMVQLWLFVTPVIYPASWVPERYRPLLFLNPMAGFVEGFRTCLLKERWPEFAPTAISLSVAVVVFIVGWIYFHCAERSFADVI